MNRELLAKIKAEPRLPSLPGVAVRVLELAKQENASVATVGKVISADPALSAKVIRTVNSSFYGLPHQVSTINHALVLLGMQTVKTVALGFSLVGALSTKKSAKFNYLRFWRQSLYSAVAARTIDKTLQRGTQEEAFLAGLLSDIGTLAMHQALGQDYDVLLEASNGNQLELIRLSRQRFDLDHAQVGAMLAEHWKFPPALVEPIRQHHSLEEHGESVNRLAEVVYTGVLCGQVFSASCSGLLQRAIEELGNRFAIPEAQTKSLLQQIDAQSTELAELFEVTVQPGRSYADIEQEARQMLVDLALQNQMRSKQLVRENASLQKLAATDSLTGLANRAQFTEILADAFAEARATHRPLSVLFLDLDKFKSINDTHGHPAGDAVLRQTAALVKKIASHHKTGRYGGEELAVVLRKHDTGNAIELAERIRAAIEAQLVDVGEKTVGVTASIGVATESSGCAFPSADDLLAAADQAVYAAKQAGRNCVRAHSAPAVPRTEDIGLRIAS
jgi:two-component system cell cycle response regulator